MGPSKAQGTAGTHGTQACMSGQCSSSCCCATSFRTGQATPAVAAPVTGCKHKETRTGCGQHQPARSTTPAKVAPNSQQQGRQCTSSPCSRQTTHTCHSPPPQHKGPAQQHVWAAAPHPQPHTTNALRTNGILPISLPRPCHAGCEHAPCTPHQRQAPQAAPQQHHRRAA